MTAKVWGVSSDGKYEYVSLTKDKIKLSLEVLRKSFIKDESMSIGAEVEKHPKAGKELEEFTLTVIGDGVSLIAVEKETGLVVATSFNKIQVPKPKGEGFYESYASKCKEPESAIFLQCMAAPYAKLNLFEHCKVDCFLEFVFMATLKEHRGKGIGGDLVKCSIELTKQLNAGNNFRVPVDDTPLPLESVPKMVAAVFTGVASQRMGASAGFIIATETSYDDFTINGKKFSERIGPKPPTAALVYKRY